MPYDADQWACYSETWAVMVYFASSLIMALPPSLTSYLHLLPLASIQETVTGGGTRDHETSSLSSDDEGRRAATAGILGAAGGLGGAAAMGQHSRGRREIGEGGNVTNVHPDWSKERVHMTEDERRIGGPVHLSQEGARVRPVGGGATGTHGVRGDRDTGVTLGGMGMGTAGMGGREGEVVGEEEQQPGMLAKATAAAGAAVGMIRVSKG